MENERIILITGGASGIGLDCALSYIKSKAFVIIVDMDNSKGLELEKQYNNQLKYFNCDVSNEDSVKEIFDEIEKKYKKIDVLINSAGIVSANSLLSINSEVFKKVFMVNTFGTFLFSKYAAKLMIKSKTKGVIVMISSILGIEGQRGMLSYSSSKGALNGMTLPMARDLGKYGIRVNTIAPGLIVTPMSENSLESEGVKISINQSPLKMLGKPEHITKAIHFIDENKYLNGEILRIDGGVRLPHF